MMATVFGSDLCYSRPRRNLTTTAEAFSVSIVFHVILLAGALWLTIAPPEQFTAEQQHILIPIAPDEEVPEPPPPPPPQPQMRELPASVTDAPRGFQTLTVPTYISPDIPPPTVGAETDEADFTGEGVEGGRGRGEAPPTSDKVVTTEDISAAPAFTPYTVAPSLRNRAEVGKLLERAYPVLLRDAGITGRVMMWLFIDARGEVKRSVVKETSGFEALDSAALRVSHQMRFSPAQNRDVPVPVWVSLPIAFEIGDPAK